MKDLRLAVDQIIEKLAFAEDEFAQRMTFLEVGDEDIAFLRELHELLGAGAADMADEFYYFIQQAPALQHLLKDVTSVERLKKAQAEYFRSLTAGEYGKRYLRDRLGVGIVHQRIGLDPKWYIGAYRKYFQAAVRRVRESLGSEHERVAPMADALLKTVCLDMGART